MAALAYIDETGLHIPTYETVLERLKEDYRGIYGQDVYLEPDSQDGELLAVLALRIHDCYTLAASVYNSFSPATAQGVGLSRIVKINGLNRNGPGHSYVDLRVVGQVGTIITNGVATDKAGQRWLLPATVVIPAAGEVIVTATAEEAGDIRAAAGEITYIARSTRGWQSVSNPAAAVPGAAVEKDSALRQRQAVSTALPSQTVFEGILGALANLTGVTRLQGYENDTPVADANGLPPHSIALVVEGGDTQEIATTIAVKKTPGAYTHGTTSVEVRDKYGSPNIINFFRPTPVVVSVGITIRPLTGYLASTGERIRQAVAASIQELDIGEDLLLSRLYSPINAAEAQAGARSFDVISLAVGANGQSQVPANLVIAFDQVASCALADVTLVMEP